MINCCSSPETHTIKNESFGIIKQIFCENIDKNAKLKIYTKLHLYQLHVCTKIIPGDVNPIDNIMICD